MSRESEYVEYGRWLAEHVLTRPLTEDQIDRAARIQADALREARLAEREDETSDRGAP